MSDQLSTQEFRETSVKKIAVASVASLGVAVLVFVGAVLPAEYGVDPLGTGDAFGLLCLRWRRYQLRTVSTSEISQN